MKITQSGAGAPAGRGRKTEKAQGSSQAFQAHISEDGAPETPATTAKSPLAALSSLLAVQEVPDPLVGKRRAVQHGDTLLEELKDLQIGLVQGWISEEKLQSLASLLERPRPTIDDPDLNQVLDDIELRAAVELAKLERRSP